MSDGFKTFITAPERDRLDIFLAASRVDSVPPYMRYRKRLLGFLDSEHSLSRAPIRRSPRLLFKGGTSLSKAHDLIRGFSEDIDIRGIPRGSQSGGLD